MSPRRGLPADQQAQSAAHSVVGDLRHPQPPRDRDTGQGGASQRAKLTVQIAADIVEELRDAVVYLPTQGVRATVAAITQHALRQELNRLRDEHHHGRPFPSRGAAQPSPGRPIDSQGPRQ